MLLVVLVVVVGVASSSSCNESLACPCLGRVFSNGFGAVCEQDTCRFVSFPGDLCGGNGAPQCVSGVCKDGVCAPNPVCTRNEDCSVVQWCVGGSCVDRAFFGEPCNATAKNCLQENFCAPDGTCELLFLGQPGCFLFSLFFFFFFCFSE